MGRLFTISFVVMFSVIIGTSSASAQTPPDVIDDVVAGDENWIIVVDEVAADSGGWITAVDESEGVPAYHADTANGFEAFGKIEEHDDGIVAFGRVVVETNIHSECIGECGDYERLGQRIEIDGNAHYTADEFGHGSSEGRNEIHINEKKKGHLKNSR